jgi:hypothetical protein
MIRNSGGKPVHDVYGIGGRVKAAQGGGWPTLSRFSLLTSAHGWMIPLQYVIAEGLV